MGKNYAIKEIGIHRLSTAYPPLIHPIMIRE